MGKSKYIDLLFFEASGPQEHSVLWIYISLTMMPNHTVRNLQTKVLKSGKSIKEEKIPWDMPRAMTSLHTFCLLSGQSVRPQRPWRKYIF
jgi:hypothetical protein